MRFRKIVKPEVIESRNLNQQNTTSINIPPVNATQEMPNQKELEEIKTQISLINEKIADFENRIIKLESINYTAQIEENNLMNSEQLFRINQRMNCVTELEKTIQDTQSKFEHIVLNLKNEIDELKTKQV